MTVRGRTRSSPCRGRQVCGVELKLAGQNGEDLAHDSKSVAELKVRGNWVVSGYFKGEGGNVVDDKAGSAPATSPPSIRMVMSSSRTA